MVESLVEKEVVRYLIYRIEQGGMELTKPGYILIIVGICFAVAGLTLLLMPSSWEWVGGLPPRGYNEWQRAEWLQMLGVGMAIVGPTFLTAGYIMGCRFPRNRVNKEDTIVKNGPPTPTQGER